MAAIPCVIVRGGTSKGVYLNEADLPQDPAVRDALICDLMGSGDSRQVDGIGGGDPLTSKVAILSAPTKPGADVDYLSGEVRLRRSEVNYGIMCGNLAAGVGPAAYQLGLLGAASNLNKLKIFNRNSHSIIDVGYLQALDSTVGSCFTATLIFNNPVGNNTGGLLPTGKPIDSAEIEGVSFQFSVVDAGAIYAFISAADLSLRGDEAPAEIDCLDVVRDWVEQFRHLVSERINAYLPADRQVHTGQIKIALISPPASSANQVVDIVGRIINPAKTHKAYAVSGAIATCVAASTHGTLVRQLCGGKLLQEGVIQIAHPEGVLEVGLTLEGMGAETVVRTAEIVRTARVLMSGLAFTHSHTNAEPSLEVLEGTQHIL